MTHDPPLVSIITPAYNRASFLEETILSVLTQGYPRLEYLVLDDGSTDNTQEVLKKYQDRLRWESHDNIGETCTVNKGFGMVEGEIVCVVNSDDPLLPGAVSAGVTHLQRHPEALAAYPDWREIGPDSETIKDVRLPQYTLYTMLTGFNVGMGPGTFISRRAFEVAGVRDTQFRYVGDLEFWFRLATHGQLHHIPEVLATHRTHPDSASVSARGAVMAGELVRMVEKVYRSDNLSAEVRSVRRKVLALAHKVAVHYCAGCDRAALKHHLHSLWQDPSGFSLSDVSAVVRRLMH